MKIESVAVGQTVKYDQGRAKGLKAVVTAIDTEDQRVSLKSVANGRQFTRSVKLISK